MTTTHRTEGGTPRTERVLMGRTPDPEPLEHYKKGVRMADEAIDRLQDQLSAARAEVEVLRVEYESRAAWIAKMNAILGYDNTDGFHSKPDPFEIATDLRAQLATAKEAADEARLSEVNCRQIIDTYVSETDDLRSDLEKAKARIAELTKTQAS